MKLNLQLICERLTEVAESNNETLEEFLEQNNLPINLIDDIKNHKLPKIDIIRDFAIATNCSVDYLLGFKNDKEIIKKTNIVQ